MQESKVDTFKMTKEIEIDKIDVEIPRKRDKEKHEWLKDSIVNLGLLDPIAVTEDVKTGRYKLVYGQGRLEATKKAGEKKILASIINVEGMEFYERWFSENRMRRELNPFDQAKQMAKDRENGLSLKEIAQKYFVSIGYASKMISLIERASPKLLGRISKEAKYAKTKNKPHLSTGKASEITSAFANHKEQDVIIETMDQLKIKSQEDIRTVIRAAQEEKKRGVFVSTEQLIKSISKMKREVLELSEWNLTRKERIDLLEGIINDLLTDNKFKDLLDKHEVSAPKEVTL